MHIVVREIRHHLSQRNHIIIGGRILREIVTINRDRLVRWRLASLAEQTRSITVASEQIVVDPGAQRCGRTARIGPYEETALIALHKIVLCDKREREREKESLSLDWRRPTNFPSAWNYSPGNVLSACFARPPEPLHRMWKNCRTSGDNCQWFDCLPTLESVTLHRQLYTKWQHPPNR